MTAPAYEEDAFAMLEGTLREWGLASLIPDLEDILTEGVSPEVAMLRLRETEAYKERFKGNLERQRKGLRPLTEAEYLETETALKTVLRRYGGDGSDIGRMNADEAIESWIGNDVSPQELNDRFSAYRDNYLNQPQWVRDAWTQHGFTPWQAMMAAADPSVSETELMSSLNTFAVGAEALQAYGEDRFNFDSNRFEEYAQRGVTRDEAQRAFGEVASREEREGFLSGLGAGERLTRADQEREVLFGDAEVRERRRRVLDEEAARFRQNFMGGERSMLSSPIGDY